MAKNAECCPNEGHKCYKCWGIVLLIVGLLYLAQDMAWIDWWTINWYTAAFLLMGIGKLCKLYCK